METSIRMPKNIIIAAIATTNLHDQTCDVNYYNCIAVSNGATWNMLNTECCLLLPKKVHDETCLLHAQCTAMVFKILLKIRNYSFLI